MRNVILQSICSLRHKSNIFLEIFMCKVDKIKIFYKNIAAARRVISNRKQKNYTKIWNVKSHYPMSTTQSWKLMKSINQSKTVLSILAWLPMPKQELSA